MTAAPSSVPGSWAERPLRRAVVYGLGLSGRSAARFLLARGCEVVGVDRRAPGATGEEGTALETTAGFSYLAEDAQLPPGLDLCVLSPGVPPDRPLLAAARAAGVPVVAEVELAFPFLDGPLVAITGSNGKSTTTAMTGALLEASGRPAEVCGNIGVPLTSRVAGPPGRTFVVELSSFQLEATDLLRPRAAAFLNLSPDHLDRHRSLDDYAEAKRRIFRRQRADDVAVLNAGDPWTAATRCAARRRLFGRCEVATIEDGCALDSGLVIEVGPGVPPRELFSAADVPLPGPHNLENAMAAALLARALAVEPEAIRRGLRGFVGLPHRLQKVGERAGVAFYDDSKGTNLDATAKSLEGFADGSVHLILGGRNKGADFRELAPVVVRKARRLYLIGESAADLQRVFGEALPVERSHTLVRAVEAAAASAAPGEVVLLSPACASFDQFRDFNHRGDEFQRLVGELPRVAGGG